MKVEITNEAVESIVMQDLTFMIESLRADLQKHKDGRRCAVFSTNKKEDIAEIKTTIDAIERVLKFYRE